MLPGFVLAAILLWLVWDDLQGNPNPRKEGPNWGHYFDDDGVNRE